LKIAFQTAELRMADRKEDEKIFLCWM